MTLNWVAVASDADDYIFALWGCQFWFNEKN
jgi:hypothetical protein